MKTADYWINSLKLEAHPEGGYYREVYRSSEIISQKFLPERFSGDRVFSTSIYFLLNRTDVSRFHKINQDELWHFYQGSAAVIHVIDLDGKYSTILLGNDPDAGEVLQAVVPAGCYFATEVSDKSSYLLAGCTVAPGFDFADFVMPDREDLQKKFPEYADIISRF